MGKVSRVSPHLSSEEIKSKIKKTKGFWRIQKWLVIHHALQYPQPAGTIAKHTGLSKSSVHKIISEYNRYGEDSIETVGKGGRRNSYMDLKEEALFLEPFFDHAIQGHVSTIGEIKLAYEKKINKPVHKTTVYRLLYRHGWRKITPRPYHIAAKQKEQDAFKKTLTDM